MADKQQNLIGHLDELRNRLIVTAIVFVGSFIAGFMYVEEIYKWFVRDLDYKLIVLGPSDIIWVYFMLAGVIALAITIPVLALQAWLFVKPALKPFEVKKTLSYIPAFFILFIVGLCFGYFVIFPTVLHFIVGLGGELFETSFTVEKYFKFLMNLTLPIAFLFELPVVVMFLTTIGFINPYVLTKIRKYAYFVLVVLATILSPPDFISQTLVAIPLLLLYEISISLSKYVYKRRMKRLESYNDEDEDMEEAQ
ncbi:twin-arginine translocase subunit TatC [Bacillus massiliigorillae]|uniref:twin-arginine translocase subunit TatC n=1 Tax=Bacillus massiliigorillae TaxID=1243664 RepID=UPI000399C2E2|nr:twin-arginine translocase subunit TatC [Bacillus massiliigorillae]